MNDSNLKLIIMLFKHSNHPEQEQYHAYRQLHSVGELLVVIMPIRSTDVLDRLPYLSGDHLPAVSIFAAIKDIVNVFSWPRFRMSLALARSRLLQRVPEGARCSVPVGAASVARVGAHPGIRCSPSNFQRDFTSTVKVSTQELAVME